MCKYIVYNILSLPAFALLYSLEPSAHQTHTAVALSLAASQRTCRTRAMRFGQSGALHAAIEFALQALHKQQQLLSSRSCTVLLTLTNERLSQVLPCVAQLRTVAESAERDCGCC
jgi:hypothetical protein